MEVGSYVSADFREAQFLRQRRKALPMSNIHTPMKKIINNS
jgi:hypothetical protein